MLVKAAFRRLWKVFLKEVESIKRVKTGLVGKGHCREDDSNRAKQNYLWPAVLRVDKTERKERLDKVKTTLLNVTIK